MGTPETVGAGGEPPRPGLRAQSQRQVAFQQVDGRGVEGGQPFGGRSAGTERRRAVQHRLLEAAFVLVQECHRDVGRSGEAAVEGGPAHAGGLGQLSHGDRAGIGCGEQALGGGQDPFPVVRRVGAFPGATPGPAGRR